LELVKEAVPVEGACPWEDTIGQVKGVRCHKGAHSVEHRDPDVPGIKDPECAIGCPTQTGDLQKLPGSLSLSSDGADEVAFGIEYAELLSLVFKDPAPPEGIHLEAANPSKKLGAILINGPQPILLFQSPPLSFIPHGGGGVGYVDHP
jgi:hypothetical protein